MGKLVAGLIILCMSFSYCVSANENIRIAVFDDQLVYFDDLLNQSDCPELDKQTVGSNLMLAEYLLICGFIKDQLPNATFTLVGLPIVPRIADAVESGIADVSGFGVWKGETKGYDITLSKEVIQLGEFTKGLFTSSAVRDEIRNKSELDLTQLVVVSNRNWTHDWNALECAGMNLLHVDKYEQMFQLVKKQRAEVVPLGFGKQDDFGKKAFGITLYPIEGLKLVIPDSSHYLISKKSAFSEVLKKAINEGLEVKRKSGEFIDLYESVGAIHPKTSEWRSICLR